MKKEKKWEILSKNTPTRSSRFTQDLLRILLKNRGLLTEKDQEAFLHSDIKSVTSKFVGIDANGLKKALSRIEKAIGKKEEMIVFGDYDVDGIAGTAILWETLHAMEARVTPYIPNRIDEGYGLSVAGIDNILLQHPLTKLIITVDNGIVAHEAVAYANTKGVEIILTDHHVPSKKLPNAYAIVHTTKLCGTGVAWVLSRELGSQNRDHLGLVALATVADLVPLTGANRILLTEGLDVLHQTKRPGIVALCEEAGIDQDKIGVYEIGHVLAPRLNAMGRIASAMDSLRLLCTKDRLRAKVLAEKLGITNKERQDITKSLTIHAIEKVRNGKAKLKDFLVVYDKIYEEGVIGLVAGRLVEEFYRPSIVLSIGEKISKASARSVAGFNIIEFIRGASHLLINAGGHPMAAGFTIYTEKITQLEDFFAEKLQENITDGLFMRTLKVDCELSLDLVSQNVYDSLQRLAPFGMGNPEPTFVSKAKILSVKQVGKDRNHLSFLFGSEDVRVKFSAIGFGIGEEFKNYVLGQEVVIAYTLDENIWKDKKSLQLKIKDIKTITSN